MGGSAFVASRMPSLSSAISFLYVRRSLSLTRLNTDQLIAMRLNDVRNGTNIVPGVLEKYKAAVLRNGMVNDDDLYTSFFALKQRKSIAARQGAHTAWYVQLNKRMLPRLLTHSGQMRS